MYDAHEQHQLRVDDFPQLDANVLLMLENLLMKHNNISQRYKHMGLKTKDLENSEEYRIVFQADDEERYMTHADTLLHTYIDYMYICVCLCVDGRGV